MTKDLIYNYHLEEGRSKTLKQGIMGRKILLDIRKIYNILIGYFVRLINICLCPKKTNTKFNLIYDTVRSMNEQ